MGGEGDKKPHISRGGRMEQDYITVTEYARLTGVSRQSVYKKIHKGKYDSYLVTVTVNDRKITALRRDILRNSVSLVDKTATDGKGSQDIAELKRQIEEYREREKQYIDREQRYIAEIEEKKQTIKEQFNIICENQKIISNYQLLDAQRMQISERSSGDQSQSQSGNTDGITADQSQSGADQQQIGSFSRWWRGLFR